MTTREQERVRALESMRSIRGVDAWARALKETYGDPLHEDDARSMIQREADEIVEASRKGGRRMVARRIQEAEHEAGERVARWLEESIRGNYGPAWDAGAGALAHFVVGHRPSGVWAYFAARAIRLHRAGAKG